MTRHDRAARESSSEPASGAKDFRALRAAGDAVGASKSIGSAVAGARDTLARLLIRVGATPNRITIVGLLFTCAAGYCLARGASQAVPYLRGGDVVGPWPLLALAFLLLAGACDMLDGAVARIGRLMSRAGGVLDSMVDRLSDIAIYIGCLLHFALLDPPNLTYQVLATVALCNGLLISYVKARAENEIDDCSVGYWLRGERFTAVIIGCAAGHVPAVLWQMAVSGAFTVWRRMSYAFTCVRAAERGQPAPPHGPVAGLLGKLQLWRHPRGSVAYDLVTGAHIAFIVCAPLIWPALRGTGDPLRAWLGG